MVVTEPFLKFKRSVRWNVNSHQTFLIKQFFREKIFVRHKYIMVFEFCESIDERIRRSNVSRIKVYLHRESVKEFFNTQIIYTALRCDSKYAIRSNLLSTPKARRISFILQQISFR